MSWRAACTRTSCTRGSSAWAIGYFVSRRADHAARAGAWSSWPGSVARRRARALPVELAAAGPLPVRSRGRGADLLVIPVATAVKGLPLLAFVDARGGRWRAGANGGGSHGALADEVGVAGSRGRGARRASRGREASARRCGTCDARGGHRAAGLLRRLQREQVNLAMVRSRVGRGRRPGARSRSAAYCGSLRDALGAIPGAAPAPSRVRSRAGAATGRLRPVDVGSVIAGCAGAATAAPSRGRSRWSRTARRSSRRCPPASTRAPAVRRRSASPARPASGSRRSRPRLVRLGASAGRPVAVLADRPDLARTPAARCSATASGCRSTPPIPACSSGRWPRAATSAGWRSRRPRRCASSTLPATTASSSRPSASGRPRSTSPPRPTRRSSSWRPGCGDAVQMAKAGILEIADVFVVNKADRDGAGEVVRELRQMLHLGAARAWDPPVLTDDGERRRGHRRALGRRSSEHRTSCRGVGRARGEAPSSAPPRGRDAGRRAVPGAAAAVALSEDARSREDLAARRVDPYRAAAILARTDRRRGVAAA